MPMGGTKKTGRQTTQMKRKIKGRGGQKRTPSQPEREREREREQLARKKRKRKSGAGQKRELYPAAYTQTDDIYFSLFNLV
jgi:hypothetical protein